MTARSDMVNGRRRAREVEHLPHGERERRLAGEKPAVRDAALLYLAALDHFAGSEPRNDAEVSDGVGAPDREGVGPTSSSGPAPSVVAS